MKNIMKTQKKSQFSPNLRIALIVLIAQPSSVFAFSPFIQGGLDILVAVIPPLLIFGIVLFACGTVKYLLDLWKHKDKMVAKWLLFSGLFLSMLMLGSWAVLGFFQTQPGLESASGPGGIILMADVTQDTILLGASHNVFVGKVLAQTGTTENAAGPRTQYSVEVLSNIKGNLDGIVTAEQEGGFADGVLYSIEDAFPMLEPGSTYILAARYNEPANAYTIIANKNAGKLLSSDSALDKKDIKVLLDKDKKIKSLEVAYANEVLLDADIAHNNTRNSFQSLPPEAKAAAQARADAARASLGASAE
jgi:hypothetical protein